MSTKQKTKSKKVKAVQQKKKLFRANEPLLSVFMWGVNYSVSSNFFAYWILSLSLWIIYYHFHVHQFNDQSMMAKWWVVVSYNLLSRYMMIYYHSIYDIILSLSTILCILLVQSLTSFCDMRLVYFIFVPSFGFWLVSKINFMFGTGLTYETRYMGHRGLQACSWLQYSIHQLRLILYS